MLAVLCLTIVQGLEPYPPSRFDRVIPIAIDSEDPVIEGRGRAERIEYVSEFSGTLHLWTSMPEGVEVDAWLRVENADGTLVDEDEDSGGGMTPYVKLEVETGLTLIVMAGSRTVTPMYELRLHAVAAPETPITIAAAQLAWHSLAEAERLRLSGELQGARTLVEEALDRLGATPGAAESEFVNIYFWMLGAEAYNLSLEQLCIDALRRGGGHHSRCLPRQHSSLQYGRSNLAIALKIVGDLDGARAIEEAMLDDFARRLPAEHPDLLAVQFNLANTLRSQGDLEGARALEEHVVEVRTRTLPPDHSDLHAARANLANILYFLGDLTRARAMQELVLEDRLRTLHAEHSDVLRARFNLASTLDSIGDHDGARAHREAVLAVLARTLPPDHPELQLARTNLANSLGSQGDYAGARALQEAVFEVYSRTLPADHAELQAARINLAGTLIAQGDHAGARALLETANEVLSRTLPGEHPNLQIARLTLADALSGSGDLTAAYSLQEAALQVFTRTMPADHPDLQRVRAKLVQTVSVGEAFVGNDGSSERASELERMRKRCVGLLSDLAASQVLAARQALLESPAREAEARCADLEEGLDLALAFAFGYGAFGRSRELDSPSFLLCETTRGATLSARAVARAAADEPRYAELRRDLVEASAELTRLAQAGTSSEAFDAARRAREVVERGLMDLGRAAGGGAIASTELAIGSIASALGESAAAVGFRRFTSSRIDVADEPNLLGKLDIQVTSTDRLCAFVVRGTGTRATSGEDSTELMSLIDLGPIEPIDAAVERWREALGIDCERGLGARSNQEDLVRRSGEELRRLVFDPLIESLGAAQRVVIALDDALHLVPFDSLPLADSPDLIRDRWQIETRATLAELLYATEEPSGTTLVALGGPSFYSEPDGRDATKQPASEATAGTEFSTQVPRILRGGDWERGFGPLPAAREEVQQIGALRSELFGDERLVFVLEGPHASRAMLEEHAPDARFLHVATHGWFASNSIKSWYDPRPIDQESGLGRRRTGAEVVRGMSPMLLCGLALAGANLPEDAVGRPPGLITADELSTLDLSGCELAVLSACDTNVGIRRAGQGVASLQRALQMAGARTVITSLWKVPDEATKELMLDFYRRIWFEKTPKADALWAAKKRMRDAKDERGQPRYSVRDWAGWVLTGDPN